MRTRWFASFAVVVIALSRGVAWGQAPPPPGPHHHISLPPQYGATVASTIIFAQASYIAAVGDFLESAAIARRHNAIAAEHEMRNSVLWVQTYFERRALNRAYPLKENPAYLDKEESRQKQQKRLIEKLPQNVIAGDVTHELNWMLRELAAASMAYQLMPGPQSLADSVADQKLDSGDVHHIRLTDGAKVGGSKAVRAGGPMVGQVIAFRADAADPTATRWPRALRTREFDEPRRRFEEALKGAAREIGQTGQRSREKEEALMAAIDRLSAVFNGVYPAKENAQSPQTYLVYQGGKRYLQSLAGGVLRLLETNDAHVFDGSYRFTGDSVVDLMNHLCRYGLGPGKGGPGKGPGKGDKSHY
ncbi:MAG TPA: hypothetical protein VNH11_11560 [Pirellulales bacterium]|nr:hypothetical protein [Pirellulales bacterium]